MKKKLALLIAVSIVAVVIFAGCAAPPKEEKPTATPTTVKTWRWATADPGSYGYRVITGMVDILKRNLPQYDFSIKPYSSTTAAIKGFCKDEAESVYLADLGFGKLYNFTGPFEGFEPEVKQMPVQTFWAYTMETFILIPKDKADEIKSWSDLDGKPVFLTPAGYMNHLNIRRALNALGVNPQHVEVDSKFVCKAIEDGTIVATALYTTAGRSLPTWGQELMISCKGKLIPLNPTPEEIEKLKEAGLDVKEIDAKKVSEDFEGVIYGVPFYFGYHSSLKMSEEDIYTMLKTLDENSEMLASVDPGLEPLAKNFAEFQYKGVKSCDPSVIPVHPGLAKFLKEKGLWESEWDKYIAK